MRMLQLGCPGDTCAREAVSPGNHLSSADNRFVGWLSFSLVVFSIFWVDRQLRAWLRWECSVTCCKGTFDTAPVVTS